MKSTTPHVLISPSVDCVQGWQVYDNTSQVATTQDAGLAFVFWASKGANPQAQGRDGEARRLQAFLPGCAVAQTDRGAVDQLKPIPSTVSAGHQSGCHAMLYI